MEMYRCNAQGERIAVVEVDEETGEETLDPEATARLNDPEAKRERAYVAEADPIRDRAMSYQMEADGWRLEGDGAKALEAEGKRDNALREYVAKKEEIRARYPDDRFYLTTAGTYHREGCSYTTAAGEWLFLQDIADRNPSARTCSRCEPPDLYKEISL